MKKIDTVLYVHPSMSVNLTFDLTHNHNYKVFSIVTKIESDKIELKKLQEQSDYFFAGGDNVELDYLAIKEIVEKNNLNIVSVVNGIDATLFYNDYLVNKFMNMDLDLEYSKIRTNKFEVHTVLEEANIHTIPSSIIREKPLSLLTLEHLENDISYPLIVKPTENTASMAGFRIINNRKELNDAVEQIIGNANEYYGGTIDELIVQKYISLKDYDEYVIDFYTINGKHYLQGITIYDKIIRNNEIIYRTYRPLTMSESASIEPLINYVQEIITTLKVKYGFTHNEVFWDGKDSFYFIESNNRFAGGGITNAYKNCYGYSPIETMLIGQNPDGIDLPVVPNQNVYYSLCLHIYNHGEILPTRINIEDLQSYQEIISFYPEKKAPLDIVDYNRAQHIAATILLSNASREQLYKDIELIIERENDCTLFI